MDKEFNIVKKGYSPEEVDEYIKSLEAKIEEYKEKDTSITNAIVNAQVAADNIIRNAKFEAEEIRNSAVNELSLIYNSIEEQKLIVKDFQNHYIELVNKYLKEVNHTDFLKIFGHINELENYISSLKKAEKSRERNMEDE